MAFTVVGDLVTATDGFAWLDVGDKPADTDVVGAFDLKVRHRFLLQMPSSRSCGCHHWWLEVGGRQGAPDQEFGTRLRSIRV